LGIAVPVDGALVLVIAVDAFAQIGTTTATIITAPGKICDGKKNECENARPKP
jgi:hypothetical protein